MSARKTSRNEQVIEAYREGIMLKVIADTHGISLRRVVAIAKQAGLCRNRNYKSKMRGFDRARYAAALRASGKAYKEIAYEMSLSHVRAWELVQIGQSLINNESIRTNGTTATGGTLAAMGKADTRKVQGNASSKGEGLGRRGRDVRGGTRKVSRGDEARRVNS